VKFHNGKEMTSPMSWHRSSAQEGQPECSVLADVESYDTPIPSTFVVR